MASILDSVDRLTQLAGRNKLELLMFRLEGRQRYGINVFKVREVIRCPPLTRMPAAHPVVCGIASIRGQTISVMDLGAAVAGRPLDHKAEAFVIVAEYNRRVIGFLVGGVDRIVNKNWAEIKPPPKGIGRANYLTAVTEVDGELVEVIDVEKVLAEVMGMKTEVSAPLKGLEAAGELRPCVFVADDSAVARKQVVRVLEQIGVDYRLAENGRQAWEMLLEEAAREAGPVGQRVAMVISDIEMPEMDGYTLAKHIKEHPQLKDLYVCLHTSLSGSFNEAMVKRVGADRLVAKFDPDELAKVALDHIQALAATRRAA